jgi:hypothetical protein
LREIERTREMGGKQLEERAASTGTTLCGGRTALTSLLPSIPLTLVLSLSLPFAFPLFPLS